MNYFSSDFKLGILGGGQLGKMLLYETRKWDIFTKVLDDSLEAPSRIACNEFMQGSLLDYDTVYNFGKDVDVLTIEIENVNLAALAQLQKEGVRVFPQPAALQIIQNKATQKLFYANNNIPTAPFQQFDTIDEVVKLVDENKIALPFVWKAAKFGYDGQGVKIVRHINDLQDLPTGTCITENMIPFKKELAVVVARNSHGQVVTYPVVEMEFHPEANQVEYVLCPARITEQLSEKARALALAVSEKIGLVGLLAVEMFLTENDELLVNEVAPRPHNSGHYSIEASYTNQFEQHLRAILDLPLGSTKSKLAGVMINLVGAEGHTGDVVYENMADILAMDGVTPHIYGKAKTRPFRKMGHVSVVHEDINTARALAKAVKGTIRVISK